MSVATDFTIDYVNKRIYHSANSVIYTVNALYSYLMDTFDELEQMDDPIPMSAQTPTEYTLINGWFMNQARIGSPSRNCFEFLKGGAIQTSGWASGGIRAISYNASTTSFDANDIGSIITGGTTTHTGKVLDYDERYGTNLGVVWIRPTSGTDTFNDYDEAFSVSTGAGGVFTSTFGNTAGSASGENLWPNIYTLGSILEDDSQQIYLAQKIYPTENVSRIFSGTEWWPDATTATQQIDVLVKTKEMGTELDSGNLTVFLRHYGATLPSRGTADLYDHFGIDLTAGGRNAVPLATSQDLNNTTDSDTVATYTDIKIAFVNGTITYSAITGSFSDFETVTGGTSTATGLFVKQTTTTGSGTMTLGNVNGTFANGEILLGGTSGATALSSSTLTKAYTTTKAFEQGDPYNYSVIVGCASRTLLQVYQYFKYITRVGSTYVTYPTTQSAGPTITHTTQQGQLYIRAHEDNLGSNVFSPVKVSPFGTFAGGKYFGAQGVWIQTMAAADVQNFQLIDSDGNTRTPPNKQNITITNLLSGDRVTVFKTSGGAIQKDMYTSSTGNDAGDTTFVVTVAIAQDTPTTGFIRIVDVSDNSATRETRYAYGSWSTLTFSGISPALDRTYANASDTAYVPFIDKEATTTTEYVQVIYTADRSILIRVRRKAATAILPFETTGTFGSTGYSTSAIRTTDTIVT